MKRKNIHLLLLSLPLMALIPMLLLATVSVAGDMPDIKTAKAYLSSNSGQNEVRGIASWIAPSHSEANPITGYQTSIDFNDSGIIKPYTLLNCAADVQNARCELLGTIKLPQGEKYSCTSANKDFLNKLFTLTVQAISNGASFGEKSSSPIEICNPDLISAVPSLSPTSSPAPDPVENSKIETNDLQVDKKPTNSKNSSIDSFENTKFPDSPETDSQTVPSARATRRSGTSFFELGSDLDESARKKAQVVIISYLAIAISVTNRSRKG